jgi:serine phosphatase RsbU (regulator of sigma subunit)
MLHLTVIDAAGRRPVVVASSPFSIGRSSENQLQLTDAQVSRRHAEILQQGGRWHVRDCGSRYGTFLNDTRIEDLASIGPGDRIRVGQTEIRLDPGEGVSTGSAAYDFRQVNALLAGLRALGSGKVLDEVLAIVLDSALEVTGAERGFILLSDPASHQQAPAGGSTGPSGGSQGPALHQLRQRMARARGGVTLVTAQISQLIPDQVFATGEDKIVTDLLDHAHAAHHAGTVALGIRHVLCTPLNVVQYGIGAPRRLGVLYLDSRERGYLQQAGALHALAAEAAVVIENARLYQEVIERERAAQELRIAAQMQQSLLPPSRHVAPQAELAALTTPCRAVGGDLYDYVVRADGHLTFAVADVAGKGTSAALLTAVVQGLFAAEAETSDAPCSVVSRVNNALCRRAIGSRFVTAFYGQIAADRTLRYCNAGHNPPFLLRRGHLSRLEAGGTVMGLFDHGPYDTGVESLEPGDLLVLFSDGVTEAENAEGEELGDDRLAACLRGAADQPAAGVVDAITRDLSAFCGATPARDDVTVMVVKVR